MNSYEKENLEFERINRKLDAIFNMVNAINNKLDDKGYTEHLKELEAKVESTERELEWHKENRRYMDEGREWDRKEWRRIDDDYYRMKGEIKDDRCYPVERLDVPEVL